jgi:hypothetical protein
MAKDRQEQGMRQVKLRKCILIAGMSLTLLLASLVGPAWAGGIYWTDGGIPKIQRANLGGSHIEDLVTGTDVSLPIIIALDVAARKMYWAERGFAKIRRADLDGSNIEDLVDSGVGLDAPMGIALDVAGGKMYWTDINTNKIQRANLEIPSGETASTRTDIEDLVTSGLDTPSAIALDVAGGKMYWTDQGTDKIQRANLSGFIVGDLVTGLSHPTGIALDVAGGKMYWADDQADKIQRADLNGSDIENLVTSSGIFGPTGIALDVAGGKMYWIDAETDKIQRANLEIPLGETASTRTDVEDLVTSGLDAPFGIALDLRVTDVVVDFGPSFGIWVWMNNSSWGKLHSLSPESMVTGDLDNNGQDDLIVDFGAPFGLWVRMNNSTPWVKLHPLSPESMVTGDLDNNGQDDLIVDFGAPFGIWVWMNNSSWGKLHILSPDGMATGNIDGA